MHRWCQVELHTDGQTRTAVLDRRGESTVTQDGRMDTLSQITEVGEDLLGFALGLGKCLHG